MEKVIKKDLKLKKDQKKRRAFDIIHKGSIVDLIPDTNTIRYRGYNFTIAPDKTINYI